jgi:tRNA U34 5-methylaminomethyl-2-thiouridine-forming methyltransferase MnmC
MSDRIRLQTDDGSHTLFVPSLNETYHSRHGALQESRHVFIEMGLRKVAAHQSKIRILEIGFGTGLNALLTALEAENAGLQVEYWSMEAYPLAAVDLDGMNYAALIGTETAEATWKAIHSAAWEEMTAIHSNFGLQKIHGKLETAALPEQVDLIYFDAFAPEKQPELWTKEIFQKVFDHLAIGGMLTTYCAKGIVRRTMEAVGFKVSRVKGPPGKREMILAIRNNL